jgi:hypothetical protein
MTPRYLVIGTTSHQRDRVIARFDTQLAYRHDWVMRVWGVVAVVPEQEGIAA